MANIATNGEGKVATDRSRCACQRVGSTQDGSPGLDGVQTLPDHSDNGTSIHVLDETREERLALEVFVVFFEVFSGGVDQLERSKLEAALLKARDDGADERALHAIRLDHDIGAFRVVGSHDRFLNGSG